MQMNHNETGDFRMRNVKKLGFQRRGLRSRSIPNSIHSAFTLTELLVVITIIAILAGLIGGAATAAWKKARQARITFEIQQISGAIEELKNEYGAYPPNGMSDASENYLGIGRPIFFTTRDDFRRMFRKAFPRHDEPQFLIDGLAAGNSGLLRNGMTSAEALYFWLGGFSSDPKLPLSGPGGPSFDRNSTTGEVLEDRNPRYEFDLGRLEPRDSNGAFHDEDNGGKGRFVSYSIDLNGDGDTNDTGESRRINFWQYAPNGSGQPYAYFDTSRHSPVEYDMNLAGPTSPVKIFALKKIREGFDTSATPVPADIIFVNSGKFQILHAGLDDAWGDDFVAMSIFSCKSKTDASNLSLFPTGPFIGDIADTVSNFYNGTLDQEQE